jgi:hypothetical protein
VRVDGRPLEPAFGDVLDDVWVPFRLRVRLPRRRPSKPRAARPERP